MTEEIKTVADYSAATVGALTWFDWVSPLAGLFTIVWLGIRIWETETVQKLTKRD